MGTFREFPSAAKMRDIIKSMIRDELSANQLKWRYGRVQDFNRDELWADVILQGETLNTIRVKMAPNLQPLSSNEEPVDPEFQGAIVRIEGTPGDLWITEIVYGLAYTQLTSGNLNWITDGFSASAGWTNTGCRYKLWGNLVNIQIKLTKSGSSITSDGSGVPSSSLEIVSCPVSSAFLESNIGNFQCGSIYGHLRLGFGGLVNLTSMSPDSTISAGNNLVGEFLFLD